MSSFTIFTGPMYGAKTSRMLMQLELFKYRTFKTVLFKPALDSRYSDTDVVTHSGWSWPAVQISSGADIVKHLTLADDDINVVGVDEAFMISGVADVLIWLYRNGYNVIVSSLDMSSALKPFHEIEKMLPWATSIEKCKAACLVCGGEALYTYKKQDDDKEISIGGVELYEPRCASCHPLFGFGIDK